MNSILIEKKFFFISSCDRPFCRKCCTRHPTGRGSCHVTPKTEQKNENPYRCFIYDVETETPNGANCDGVCIDGVTRCPVMTDPLTEKFMGNIG